MAEIKFDDLYGQLTDFEKQQYEGVMGMGGFKTQYEKNPDSPLVTQNPNYEKFKQIADTQAQIPEKGIVGGMIDAINPFSEASAAEVTPTNYSSNYDIISQMMTPDQQELIFGDPNYFGNQKFYEGTSVPVASIVDVDRARTAIEKAQQIQDQKLASENLINAAPDVFNINQLGDPALREESVNVFGIDPYGANEDLIERGAVPEEGPIVGITDRGRGMPGAPTGAYEMIGGTPVAIGDVLGRQQALEKADFYEEPSQKRNLFNDLLGIASLAYTGPYRGAVKGAALFNNFRTGKLDRMTSAAKRGLGSLGTKVAGKMRGVDPYTGKVNTQSDFDYNRNNRRTTNRINTIDKTLSKWEANPTKYADKLKNTTLYDRRDNLRREQNKSNISRAKSKGVNISSLNPNEMRNVSETGNPGGDSGGRSKIVCTMMNDRYGFGSFRNKIWMKFHESYGPEYQKGYHAIFLPLVKIAKGEGKINTAVRKVLEHMGRHVTADMFKIMKGKKRDTLGRIYRAIFEPTCRIIGKIKSALGRG